MTNDPGTERRSASERLEAAAKSSSRGVLRDLFAFIKENKKWWLLPIIVVLVLLGALLILGSAGAAPFIYPLF